VLIDNISEEKIQSFIKESMYRCFSLFPREISRISLGYLPWRIPGSSDSAR